MREEHIIHLSCPSCRSGLRIVDGGSGGAIAEGALECEGCGLVECLELGNECLKRISVEEVLSACREMLATADSKQQAVAKS